MKRLFNTLREMQDKHLKCPICGDYHTHIIRIEESNSEYSKLMNTDYRNKVVAVVFECEANQHEWALVFGEHKGCCYIEVKYPTWERFR